MNRLFKGRIKKRWTFSKRGSGVDRKVRLSGFVYVKKATFFFLQKLFSKSPPFKEGAGGGRG